MLGNAARIVQCAEHVQQGLRLGHRTFGRGGQKGQIVRLRAPERQFQRQTGEVRRLDLSLVFLRI